MNVFETILRYDRDLFCRINGVESPIWDTFFGYATHFGDTLVILILLVVFLTRVDRSRFPVNFVAIGLSLLVTAGIANRIVKETFDRPRPPADTYLQVERDATRTRTVIGDMPVTYFAVKEGPDTPASCRHVKVIGRRMSRHSFPSGHTATAFAIAMGLFYIGRRRRRWLWFLPALVIGVSRIAVGVHFPLDVLFGALVGGGGTYILLRETEIFHSLGSPPNGRPLPPKTDRPLTLMMITGEASADVYGARILEEVRRERPDARAFGVGGERLAKTNFEEIADAHELSIVGFTAVIARLRTIVRIYKALHRRLREERPDALLCIDLPDFNLMLAAQARYFGIPVVFFISPQFWAWRQGRVAKIAPRVSKMIVAFPFEQDAYRDHDVPVAFHGHPLLEILKRRFETDEQAREYFGLHPTKKILVLAPGSRGSEFAHVRRDIFAAGAAILRELPDWQAAVPLAPKATVAEFQAAADRVGLKATFTKGDNYDLFAIGEFGLLCSGTVTLEAALAGLPMVIVYRGNWLNYRIAKSMIKIDRIGLPNIILGGETPVFPEMIQHDAAADRLADKALSILRAPDEYDRLRRAAADVRGALTGGETSRSVARDLIELADKGRA
ncbi:MAG: lipid-A-disaccharide synthase [Deltaproteobacteria bacterium]|nr:lipid-A-disaccharide synthase [Deltaproteobacteria bacterium]